MRKIVMAKFLIHKNKRNRFRVFLDLVYGLQALRRLPFCVLYAGLYREEKVYEQQASVHKVFYDASVAINPGIHTRTLNSK